MELYRSHVLICGGTGCASSGSLTFEDKFKAAMEKHDLNKEVKLVKTGCFGLCEAGPIVVVYPEGAFYSRVSDADIEKIVDEHLLKGRIVKDLIHHSALDEGVSKSINDVDFFKNNKELL